METTDYVSYPLALALKKAGFDWECRAHYTNDYVNDDSEDVSREVKFHYDWTSPYDYNRIVGNTSAPFIWQAQKWLREAHNISVRVSYLSYHKVWFADWLNLDSGEFDDTDATFYSYEEALADGISAALELIENEKE